MIIFHLLWYTLFCVVKDSQRLLKKVIRLKMINTKRGTSLEEKTTDYTFIYFISQYGTNKRIGG